jgi:hypothetical protein
MRAPLVIAMFALVAPLALPAPARAEDGAAASASGGDAAATADGATPGTPTVEDTKPKKFPKLHEPSLTHIYQLGLAVAPGVGYRVIAPYKDGVDCGQQAKRVCTGLLPFFLDAQASFGFAQHWDALVDLRFGVMSDFTHSHEFAVAPGVRYWVDPDWWVKFFATIQGVVDATTQDNPNIRGTDFGVRNENGFMFEVMRNLGFYVQVGETIGFARWLRFEIDGGVGVQARMP